jgi:hypothetical protein
LQKGDQGAAVAILQAGLIDLHYKLPISTSAKGLPDGIYGPETEAAVRQFQLDRKLGHEDGIAGRETFAALDGLLAAQIPSFPLSPIPTAPPLPVSRDYKVGISDPTVAPDPGAGAWAASPQTATALVQKSMIVGILPMAHIVIGDDASRNMKHYLDNTGRTLAIDLEGMIAEVPSAKKRFINEINQAKRFVEMLPKGTFHIASIQPEGAYNRQSESKNWFFAVGGYSTWGKGKASVNDGPVGREFTLEFEYKFFDRYNWDTGKKVDIFGVTVTDYFMGEFHRQGLAQEFDMTGSVSRALHWRAGEPIPPRQLEVSGGR